jgi:ketosteroid isomerase-like protein
MISVATKRISALLLLAFAMFALPASASDKDGIKAVIESQLNAFAVDDGATAYSYASPVVKMAFPSIEQFMAMVKNGYKPVYRNSDRVFGDVFEDRLGRPAMRVVLTGQDGKRYEAIYAMEQQKDGSWKIASCMIIVIPSQEV